MAYYPVPFIDLSTQMALCVAHPSVAYTEKLVDLSELTQAEPEKTTCAKIESLLRKHRARGSD